ncbi:MAG TPA: sodium:proton antiporter [Rhizomicrobium sp.]|nr:sodium:proton antiporter [Rhizomicrobium sp.]
MDLVLARTVGLLVVAILVAIVARRLRLPYAVGLVIAGMTLAFSRVNFGIRLTHDIVFDLILPPLLFEAALNLDWRELRRDALPILVMSVLGVLISAAVVVLGLHALLNWALAPALIFGVLIAATDPVTVIALFKDLGIKGRGRLLVESESLFNDGVAAVLFSLALAWTAHRFAGPRQVALGVVLLAGGGIAIGVTVGVLALLVAGRTGDHLVEIAVTVAAAYGAFLIAENLHCSGVLATVTAGLFIGAVGLRTGNQRFGISHQGREFALEFWEFLAFIANSLVFLLIGLAVSHLRFASLGYVPVLVMIALVLLGRAATVYPIALLFHSTRYEIPSREQHLLWWGGLRGALALALALSLPEQMAMRDAIVIATFGVVTFSIVVQGLTMPSLIRALSFRAPA